MSNLAATDVAASNNSTGHPRELTAAFEVARRLHKKHGKSYYFATRLFPAEIRLATYALYGFFRVPDEIVDNSPQHDVEDVLAVTEKLTAWRNAWEAAYRTGDAADPILRVTSYVFHRYGIPYEYSEYFLNAMLTDLTKTSYRDYDELRRYMHGSAAVVGLMMTHVIGYTDMRALHHAAQLGYAMQLTNFLRDIDEDYVLRKRVYLPQDELASYGLSTADIANRNFSRRFEYFMHFQCTRAHNLYEEANRGISLLQPEGRLPVRVASELYRAILKKLEARNYNIFRGRARTSLSEKLMLTAVAIRENHFHHV
ncbi:MAG TPA: phytoene/squalene synthase family protein [Abditibacteriaceae bacterium]|nr:phytoene/squalene synthase family protein [Abditibacteriaceae bacterium]